MSGLIGALDSLYDLALEHGAAWAAEVEGVACTMRAYRYGTQLEQDSRVAAGQRLVRVRKSEITEPARGEEVVIGDDTYIIADDPDGTVWEWTMTLARDY